MAEPQDTEISLGAGKLLGLFFGLALLCGAFFGVGYMIGKNSATPVVLSPDAAPTIQSTTAAKPSSSLSAPAQPQANNQDCATPGNCGGQQPNGSDLTFYKTVEEKNLNSQLTPSPASPPSKQPPTAPTPENAVPVSGTTLTAGYVVQIAAVSKQQDADALVSALRKKQYPVFVTSNPATDKLFHVQAGPFPDIKEAEAIKMRLTNDGYSPILKR